MIRNGSNADHPLEAGSLLGEIRYRKDYRRNRLSTSYRHRSAGDNNPPIIRVDDFGDQIERDDTESNSLKDGEVLNKEPVLDYYFFIQHAAPVMDDVPSVNEQSEPERENLERSNDLLKVSDDDGIGDCSGSPSLEASSITCSPSSALLDEQISTSSVPRLTPLPQSCNEEPRDKCPLDQDVEDSNSPNRNTNISDDTQVDSTFLLQDNEEDVAQAPVYTAKRVKGCARKKRKRPKQKLIVDVVNNISIQEMESQMSDTADIVMKLNLAPPTRRFMHWEEIGGAKKLFGLPGRPILARSLFQNYQRNLISQQSESDEFGPNQTLEKEIQPLECETAAEKETIPTLETATSSSDNCVVTDTIGTRLEQSHKSNQILREEDEWYYYGPNKSRRSRYLFCGDCDFKTHLRFNLVAHVNKLQHTSSTTAFPSPRKTLLTKKRRRAQLIEIECTFDHCNYKNKQQFKLEKHETFHRRKSNQHCHICSYSTRTIPLLKIHVKRDHPQGNDSDLELPTNQVDLTISESPMLEEMRENNNAQTIDDKADASSSPPDLNDGVVPIFQENTSAHPRTKAKRTKADDGDWYYNSNRKWRYKLCQYCGYKAVRRAVLENHIRKRHPSPKTALPASPKEIAPKSILLRCSHQCEYQTTNRVNLERHENHHKKKSTYKCQICSFSVKAARFLSLHVIRDHPESKVGETMPTVIESSVAAATKQKFYFFGPNKSKRIKYKNCDDCDFKTIHRSRLVTHVKQVHNPESTTAFSPSSLKSKARPDFYNCPHCCLPFKSLRGLKYHEMLHLKKSYHQCTLCSFSVSTLRHLKSHLRRVHSQRPENTSEVDHISVDLVSADSDQTATLETNPLITPLSIEEPSVSVLLFRCSLCHFQTNTEDMLHHHVKFHKKKAIHQCPCCSFSRRDLKSLNFHLKRDHTETERAKISKNEDNDPITPAIIPVSKESNSDSSFFKDQPSSSMNHFTDHRSAETRQKNNFSSDPLEAHPETTTAGLFNNSKEPFCCLDCSCLSNLFQSFHVQENIHHERYQHMFQHRSISPAREKSDSAAAAFSEAENDSVSLGFSAEEEEVRKKTEQYLVRQFGLRESYVKLQNIIVSSKLQLERNNEQTDSTGSKTVKLRLKRKYESKEKVEQKSDSKIKNEIKTLISRVEFMGKKAQISADELKKSKLKKNNLINTINDITSKRTETEIQLRMNQCKALELKLDCPKTGDNKDSLASIEESIKKLEIVVEGMRIALQALRKEKADLSENVEDAERSHFGIMEVLDGLQSELESQQFNMMNLKEMRSDSKSTEMALKKVRR